MAHRSLTFTTNNAHRRIDDTNVDPFDALMVPSRREHRALRRCRVLTVGSGT